MNAIRAARAGAEDRAIGGWSGGSPAGGGGRMAMLKHSSVRPPCDECRRSFDAAFGGICVRCRRLLCPDHLYGSLWQRLRGLLGLRAICVRCRVEARAAS